MTKRSTLTKEEKQIKKKEYDKKYYEKYKQDWNDYSVKKKCECGHEVTNLTSHRKTRLHQDIMRFISETKARESLYNPTNFISSVPQSVSTIGLGLALSSR